MPAVARLDSIGTDCSKLPQVDRKRGTTTNIHRPLVRWIIHSRFDSLRQRHRRPCPNCDCPAIGDRQRHRRGTLQRRNPRHQSLLSPRQQLKPVTGCMPARMNLYTPPYRTAPVIDCRWRIGTRRKRERPTRRVQEVYRVSNLELRALRGGPYGVVNRD